MTYTYISIIWPLLLSSVTTLFLAFFVLLKHRKARGTHFFVISMFIVTMWSFPNALEMMATELSVKLVWANVQYIAYCLSPVSLFLLCSDFVGVNIKEKGKKLFVLLIIPCITLILVWTDRWHGLIRQNIHMDYSGSYPVIAKTYGIWFYIHGAYSHLLNISSLILLLKSTMKRRSIYRKQTLLLLIGTSFIVLPNLLYISGMSPFSSDITPIFFGPAGILMLWSIFSEGMFELVPMVRTAVIDVMEAGVIITDVQGRVLDMNQAFRRIINVELQNYYLVPIEEICQSIPQISETIIRREIQHVEFEVDDQEQPRTYEMILTQLKDKKDYPIGLLGLIYDITDKKQAQKEFMENQWKMAVTDERERMSRDLHDNLGQVLGFINFQVQAIRQELLNQGIGLVTDKLDQLIEATQHAHADMREYISINRRSVRAERDFVSSLKNDIEQFKLQTGLEMILDIPKEPIEAEFNSVIMANILNIIREALNNIRKHAEAKEVRISIVMKNNFMVVSIKDNGKGFVKINNNSNIIKNKFGLDIMKERATLIGATIRVESVPNKGSRVVIGVPRTGGSKNNGK